MSKTKKLRIREDNPAATVLGPDIKEERAKQWLYPAELQQFLAAPTTRLELARFVALQTYLCARPGEAYALSWQSIELARGMVTIAQTRSPQTRELGPTKGRDVRTFPIPELLLPLLQAMHTERPSEGFLFHQCPDGLELRAALLAAGVDRPALHTTDDRSMAFRLHDCRATGISYMAMRGAPDDEVRERAGHKSFTTTLGYIRRGKLAAGAVGDPYAPLPVRIQLTAESSADTESYEPANASVNAARIREQRDSAGLALHAASEESVSGALSGLGDDCEDDWRIALAEDRSRSLAAYLLFGGERGQA